MVADHDRGLLRVVLLAFDRDARAPHEPAVVVEAARDQVVGVEALARDQRQDSRGGDTEQAAEAHAADVEENVDIEARALRALGNELKQEHSARDSRSNRAK